MIAWFRRWVRRLGTNVDRSTDDLMRMLRSEYGGKGNP
jgi:hypothetical protein